MLIIYSTGSLILLAFAHWLLWGTIRFQHNLRWVGILTTFIILALPLLYMLYNNDPAKIVGANIGLGLSFFFTWIVTLLLLLTAGIRLFIQRKKVR
ncbi:hypothetical protein [Paenibacillus sp. FSL H7-0331]|jgi:hypothetical protein|uniref:hypothetical protein n=1 Tax=Paenibacillus sp. FSL H7-0331 TaxID=1920421 RepID=UPI00096BDBFE|nr:hypothetical protein [Paenibacillus sp. FSL H7-0331]OMF04731.1 hypothetical protein BK127_33315 [Paenibacillus sp. FSL H7-0331]